MHTGDVDGPKKQVFVNLSECLDGARFWLDRACPYRIAFLNSGWTQEQYENVAKAHAFPDSCASVLHPRLCGGGSSQTDTKLLEGLQALLSQTNSATEESSSPLLRAWENLVARARKQKSFDLLGGLQRLVENELKNQKGTKVPPMQSPQPPKHHEWKSESRYKQPAHTSAVAPAPTGESGWETLGWKPRAADWQSELIDTILVVHAPDNFAQALEDTANRESAFVGAAHDAQEFEDMLALARGQRSAMVTFVSPTCIQPFDSDICERAQVKVPGTLGGGLQFRSCWVHSFAHGSPTLRTRKVVDTTQFRRGTATSAQPRRRGQSWVLRFVAPGCYQPVSWDTWNNMVKRHPVQLLALVLCR